MSEALKIKERNEDSLRKIEGIIGVGLHNSAQCILLYAPEITPQILREVPKTLDGVPVKIIRTGGKFMPLPIAMTVPPAYAIYIERTMRIRPCPGGISVGAPQITAGTLTCRAVDTKTAKIIGLSNAHVLYTPWGESEGAGKGNQVLQPGPYDGGKVPDDIIGYVDRWVPVVLNGDNLVDIAGFETGEVAPEIIELGKPSNIVDPASGDAIVKSGRTSGVTFGSIIDVNATITVSGWGDATFKDQITMTKVLDPGDSGSLVMKQDTFGVVGVGHAGSPEISVACKARNVESLLGVQIIAETISPTYSKLAIVGAWASAFAVGQAMLGSWKIPLIGGIAI